MLLKQRTAPKLRLWDAQWSTLPPAGSAPSAGGPSTAPLGPWMFAFNFIHGDGLQRWKPPCEAPSRPSEFPFPATEQVWATQLWVLSDAGEEELEICADRSLQMLP